MFKQIPLNFLNRSFSLNFNSKLSKKIMSGNKFLSTKANSKDLLDMVQGLIPPMTYESYKGQAGRIAVIGGCKEYTGAPYFAAISALKLGADLGHVFCTSDSSTVIKSYSPELIVHPVIDSVDAIEEVKPNLERMHAIVVGPGLGRDDKIFPFVKGVLENIRLQDVPLVIDADGLWMLLKEPDLIKGYSKCVLTPNVVEFNRLYDIVFGQGKRKTFPAGDLENNVKQVMELSSALGHVTIVKKGPEDIITDGMKVLICDAKGSPRRCGGQGDLLSGSLATFSHWAHLSLKQNVKSNSMLTTHGPSICGSYAACLLTRICAERAFGQTGRSTMTTDLISNIHHVVESFCVKQ